MSSFFVPVAVNLYKIREAKDTGGALFRSIESQKPQYQGLWTVSPDGRALSAHQNFKSDATWTQEVLDTLAAGLKLFGPVEARQRREVNPLPYRGTGVQTDGSISMALYGRYMRGGGIRTAPASISSRSRWMWEGEMKPDGPPVIDTLTLTAAECAQLSPPTATVGTEWSFPAGIARKLVRALSPNSDQSTMPRPEEATVAELKASVDSVKGGVARIRLAGRWAMKHLYDGKASYGWAEGEGVVTYDLKRKCIRTLLVVLHGAYRMAPPYDKEDRPTGAVVEWRRDSPAKIGRAVTRGKEL